MPPEMQEERQRKKLETKTKRTTEQTKNTLECQVKGDQQQKQNSSENAEAPKHRGFCPFQEQGVLTKTATMTNVHSLHQNRRRTNVQQLTCKIDLSSSFYYLFLSFVLLELKPFVFKWKVLGEKFWKSAKKCEKVWKIMKRFCPLVVGL